MTGAVQQNNKQQKSHCMFVFITVGTYQGHFREDTFGVLHSDLQPYVAWLEQ